MSILNVEHLSHGFGDRAIFEDVSFRLLKGEHIGLVGANGEGKSTFMNIITGRLMPDEGKIEWAKKVRVGYLDQHTALEKALNPDIIVNATGSVPTLPPITGLHDLVDKDGTNVATVLKMIERINEYPEDMKGQKIAIIGGGAVGLDVMEFFTERGAEVTMVEMLPMIGNGLDPVTKCDTNAKMAKYGVKQMTNTALQEVKNDRFIVKNPEGEIEEIPFDYGFICLGMRANTPVLSELDEAFSNTNVEIVNIGDSKRARRIIEGTEEGRNILNVLARHDYL